MRASALAGAALVLLFAACGGDESTGPTTEFTVEMLDNSFFPQSRTISPNTRIRWVNVGIVQHNTTSTQDVWESGNINPGGTFFANFSGPGTYPYECTLHAGMTGTIVVQ
jgi:plastocyanin